MSPYDRALNYLTDLNVVELALTGKLGEIQSEKRRVGIFIEMYQRFSLDEPRESEQTGANGSPSAEVVPAAVETATAEGASSPSAPIPAAPGSHLDSGGTEPAKLAVEEPLSNGSGEVQDRSEPTSPPVQEPAGCHPADALTSEAAEGNEAVQPAPETHAPEAQAEEGGATTPSSATRAKRPAKPGTLRARIEADIAQYPNSTARQISDRLGVLQPDVASLAIRHNLAIRKLTPEEIGALRRDAGRQGGLLKAGKTAEVMAARSEAPRVEPAAPPRVEPPRPVNDDEIIPPNRNTITKPKGKLFWLRNADGEYLHRYCDRMTRNRKEAWTGTEAQILGCRRNFSIARDLIERQVEKEQVVA